VLSIALGGFPFQVFAAFLERRFDGPTLPIVRHHPLRLHARLTTPLGGTIQGDQEGESPRSSRERQLHEPRHDDSCMPPAVGRIAVRRPHAIALPFLAKHLGARMFGHRMIASEEHRPRWDYIVRPAPGQCTRHHPR